MKRIFFVFLLIMTLPAISVLSAKEKRSIVRLETSMGVIRIALSDDTPVHRDNFLRNTELGLYNGSSFHRVIKDFMIQGGIPTEKAVSQLADSTKNPTRYLLPPEIALPYLYHKQGAVGMAREPDESNPDRLSDGAQFYIVWGKTYSSSELKKLPADFTLDMSLDYRTKGGAPQLDGSYTVFGEVIEGLDVVGQIQEQATNADNDRPIKDILILKATVEQKSEDATNTTKRKSARRTNRHLIY